MKAQVGDRVRIQYTRIRSSEGVPGPPPPPRVLEFTIGGEHMLPGLSRCVAGMHQGEEKFFSLRPAEAFGDVQSRLIREVPRERLRTAMPLAVGMVLRAKVPGADRPRRVRVVKLTPSTVVVDGNHPSAGRTIDLAVLVLSIDSSSETNESKPQFDTGGES
jgi:FKBP-type peptidyl-prolyl cis-trans isomerase 2